MNWKPDVTSGLMIQTPFCRLSAFRVSGRKEQYGATVDGHRGHSQRLVARNDFTSLEAAQVWCEATYKELLLAELARLDPAAQG